MEVSSSSRRSRDEIGGSVRFPIEGMKTVVVTVTGYTGIERFNLIKLITKAGANYVGRMSPSITHLVCWKFYEGKKFSIAKKHKMFIVNHQWIEDCVKEGKRVREEPYTLKCGYQVGPLKFDASLISDMTRCPNPLNDRREPSELRATQSSRSQEKRASASPESSHGGRKRRLVRRNSVSKQPLIISSDSDEDDEAFHELYHGGGVPDIPDPSDEVDLNATEGLVNLETSNSDSAEPSHRVRRRRLVKNSMAKEASNTSRERRTRLEDLEVNLETSNSGSAGPSHGLRRRRLVKKNMTKETSNTSRERRTRLEDPEDPSTLAASLRSSTENEGRLSDFHADGSTVHECGENRTEIPTEDVNDVPASDDPSLPVTAASSDHNDDKNDEDRNVIEPTAVLPKATACVICLTNFSATRGVLPCGHRFCFSCIENWAFGMIAAQKPPTCPLCKAVFSSIAKVDYAVSSDQKIYSQTAPDDDSRVERIHLPSTAATPNPPSQWIHLFSGAATPNLPSQWIHLFSGAETPNVPSHSVGLSVCCICNNREPVEDLRGCNLCQNRSIHTWCLDPPIFPWTCRDCMDLQRLLPARSLLRRL